MDLGTEATSPLWQPPQPKERPRRPFVRSVVTLLAVLAVVGGTLGAFLLLSGDDGPHYPDRWDPRLEELVAFVERERGLDFRHPVEAEFLPEQQFRDRFKANDDLTDEQRKELEEYVALMRALGLLDGELDLVEAMSHLDSETTLAFYDPAEKHIVVRGTELDAATRVTVVHELTHALQDQHFEIDSKLEDDTSFAFRGLVEGDATVVEEAYLGTLSAQEQREYGDFQQDFGEDVDLGDVPDVFLAIEGTPYAFGPGLVTALLDEGGHERLDEAFREPPSSDMHLFDPTTFLRGEEPALLETPELADGEARLEGDEDDHFGAVAWFLVLAERIDAHEALAAVDGMGGDVAIAFERDGKVCGRLAFSGKSDEDTDEMGRALQLWVEEMPAGVARSERDGDVVTLTSCDPGTDSNLTTGQAVEAFALPAGRALGYRELLTEGAMTSDQAWCAADAIVNGFPLDVLVESSEPTAEQQQEMTELVLDCMGT